MLKFLMSLGLALLFNTRISHSQEEEEEYCPNISTTKPAKTSTCWQWNAVGKTKDLRTGCDNKACENAVCTCDPYCCEISWDLACVGYSSESSQINDNPFSNGCSAHRLCCGFSSSTTAPEVVGNQVICDGNDNSTVVVGYTSIDDINVDIASSSLDIDVFVLCPNTTFFLDDDHDGFLPIRNTTRVQCGMNGGSNNNCTIVGGNSHIFFDYDIVATDVVFQGITFTESIGASLSAWGPPSSYASFLDCHWKNNVGYDTVDILYQQNARRKLSTAQSEVSKENSVFHQITSNYVKDKQLQHMDTNYLRRQQLEQTLSPASSGNNNINNNNNRRVLEGEITAPTSMTIIFNDCSFINNRQKIGVILNVGGVVQLIKCFFHSNEVSGVTVGVAGGGRLLVDPQSTFINNTNYFSTIFVDHNSFLTLSADATGSNNTGSICDDVFKEAIDSSCLGSGGANTCNGTCTGFRK